MEEPTPKTIKKGFTSGTGRRKTAIASVFLYAEKGDILVNDVNIDEWYTLEKDKVKWMRPFHLIGVSHPNSQFSGTIKIKGSGKSAQLGAIVHGISQALSRINEEYSKLKDLTYEAPLRVKLRLKNHRINGDLRCHQWR